MLSPFQIQLPSSTRIYDLAGFISTSLTFKHFYLQDITWASSFYIHYFVTFGPFYGIFGTMVLIYLVK